MKHQQLWYKQINWLLKNCGLEDCNKSLCKQDEINNFLSAYTQSITYEEFIKLKILIRNIYLKHISNNYYNSWISREQKIENDHIVYINNDDTYYERTAQSSIENLFIKNFQHEFIDSQLNKDYYKLFLTNSGMSACLLALQFSHMLSKNDSIIIQNDMYFELQCMVKSTYKNIQFLTSNEIYEVLKKDSEDICVFVGYTKTTDPNNILSLPKLFDSISSHTNNHTLFLIIDRTFFSLTDSFYTYLNLLNTNKNIVIISVESLLKHYQYGLELTTLGALFVYSNRCKSKLYTNVLMSLYNSLGVRLSPLLYARLFPFNKSILKESFKIACKNANLFYKNIEYESIIPIGIEVNNGIQIGDVLYINIDNIQTCDKIINYTQKKGVAIHGQSFGLDLTRVCCEVDAVTGGVRLRISFGLEDEKKIYKLSKTIKDALRMFCTDRCNEIFVDTNNSIQQ